MNIEEMAVAHLQTVQQSINELENQKNLIDQEILRLTEYLKAGQETIDSSQK